MVDFRPSERYKRIINLARSPSNSNYLTQPESRDTLFGRENVRSLLLKCGESLALRGCLQSSQQLQPTCEGSVSEGYTESPWYETPFYEKLRGGRPLPPDPPETEPESTDEDLMNNLMGHDTSGPSTPGTSIVDEIVAHLPSGSEDETDEDDEEIIIDRVNENSDTKQEGAEGETYDIYKLAQDDDEPLENKWEKDIEEELRQTQYRRDFWDY